MNTLKSFWQWCKDRAVERRTWEGLIWVIGPSLGAYYPKHWMAFLTITPILTGVFKIVTKDVRINVFTKMLKAITVTLEDPKNVSNTVVK